MIYSDNWIVSFQAATKRESMKRAQSVEVLSLLADKAPAPPPPDSPPPLPPREREVGPAPGVHAVLSHAPALVNTDLVIVPAAAAEKPAPPPPTVASSGRAARPSAGLSPAKKQPGAGARTGPGGRRVSTGVLFGVKDKELPAPDIVKQTRKLFEANPGSGTGRRFGAKSGMTKAKSTSSLYKPPSRSNSVEAPLSRAGRKKSEEDLSSRPPFLSSGSPRTAATSSSSATPRLPSKQQSAVRPALPAKPSHLSSPLSAVTKPGSFSSSIVERHVQKVTPTKVAAPSSYSKRAGARAGAGAGTAPPSRQGLVKASLATVIPAESSKHQDAASPGDREADTKPILLNLRPLSSAPGEGAELGTKRVTPSSIQNIRNSGNHVNFKFDADKTSGKTHLPGMVDSKKTLPPKQVRFQVYLLHTCQPVAICSHQETAHRFSLSANC